MVFVQEHVLTGGHGLVVQGYDPVVKALATDLDIRLNHRFVYNLLTKLYDLLHNRFHDLCHDMQKRKEKKIYVEFITIFRSFY